MNNQSYDEARMLADQAHGPLAPFIRDYHAAVVEKGYIGRGVYVKIYRAADFDRWLHREQIPVSAIDDQCVERYHARDSGTRRVSSVNERPAMRSLLAFLRAKAAIAALPSVSAYPAIDASIDDFRQHLHHARGLTVGTIDNYWGYARDFLIERFGGAPVDLGAIAATDVIAHVQQQATRLSPGSVKLITTALRAFLRYLQYLGKVDPELIAAIPAVAHWATTPPIPRAISPEDARQLLAHCSGRTPREIRDRAILLLLARLGLRSGDIVNMTLDDVDWENGSLRMRGKGRRECFMPLPPDVGEAIAIYLRDARPHCDDRRLFLRARAPFRGFNRTDCIGSVVKNTLAHAGIDAPRKGAHQFRHALAVRLLGKGASLPEIGEVLRHRSPQATAIYARVDIDALRDLVVAWPGEAA
ncbi:tyrosine-type recombinase/integrase [Falsirhodobacter sp. 1013]|uniref:tyrosine-type recombinase/integrase n=1 Tax=Falsirhodobacter sp. 1013 TaxID=3417566 RepID=UPI003EBDCA6D